MLGDPGHASGRTRRSRSRGPPRPRSGSPRPGRPPRRRPADRSRRQLAASVGARAPRAPGHRPPPPGPRRPGGRPRPGRSGRPTRSRPTIPASGSRTGTAVSPGWPSARPGPTRRTSVTGSPRRSGAASVRPAGTWPGRRAPSRARTAPGSGPPGPSTVPAGRSCAATRTSIRGGRGRGHGVEARGDRHRGEHRGQQPTAAQHRAAYRRQQPAQAVTGRAHASTLGESPASRAGPPQAPGGRGRSRAAAPGVSPWRAWSAARGGGRLALGGGRRLLLGRGRRLLARAAARGGRGRRLRVAAVVAVEAGALEDDADGVEQLAQPAVALRALRSARRRRSSGTARRRGRTRCRRTGRWARGLLGRCRWDEELALGPGDCQ